jgi:hypothetical protein
MASLDECLKPLYPVEACWFGRKFAAAARLGFADFQTNYRGKILRDSDLYPLFDHIGVMKDLPHAGFFVGFVIGLHENPVDEIPSDLSDVHLLHLGNGSVLACATTAFDHGYYDGIQAFRQQCQTPCETGWDLMDRLRVLHRKQCVRTFINDCRVHYNFGKATW